MNKEIRKLNFRAWSEASLQNPKMIHLKEIDLETPLKLELTTTKISLMIR